MTQINGKKAAVKVKDVIGSALPSIGAYKKLDNKKQVVALIDDVSHDGQLLKLFSSEIIFRIYVSTVENVT